MSSSPSSATLPANPRVMVVDDVPANLVLMRGVLKKLSCELTLVSSGAEALKHAAEQDFALILLDVHMPDMDGFEVASRLAQHPRSRDVPIIFVTATHGDEINRVRGYRVGAVDYMAKPFDTFILQSKVQVFLDLYNSRRELRGLLDTLNQRNALLEEEIAERLRAEEQARHQATHDPLTDLPNRLLLMDRLQTGIARAQREQTKLALIYIDIDHFKPVNDQYGHQAGDALLCAIAARLSQTLRQSDTVARLGGDEFAAILERVTGWDEAGELIRKLQAKLTEPYLLYWDEGDPVEVHIGASIGLSLFPDQATTEDGLIRIADASMYSKKQGRR